MEGNFPHHARAALAEHIIGRPYNDRKLTGIIIGISLEGSEKFSNAVNSPVKNKFARRSRIKLTREFCKDYQQLARNISVKKVLELIKEDGASQGKIVKDDWETPGICD